MIKDIATLRLGQKVYYQPEHYVAEDKWENGIIKSVNPNVMDGVFVVYNCAGNWDKYEDYTAAMTNLRDLHMGWRH